MSSEEKRVVIGADHAGFELKQKIVQYLGSHGYKVIDVGCYDNQSVDYPKVSETVIRAKVEQNVARAVIVCGSGVGVAIAANRYNGVRAVTANDLYSARWSRVHNDSNVLCLGGRVVAVPLAYEIVDLWFETPFEGGRHQGRVDQMDQLDKSFQPESLTAGDSSCSTSNC